MTLQLAYNIIHQTSLRILYLAQSDTVTHYLRREPEASAPRQGMGYSNRRQQTDHMHPSPAATLVSTG